ncbi:hypothetical protein [Leisingera daeponensis]|uniref:hypothetical protein n=1 Tax=Leisingera daeponensis TaxID=405746 RepID=UPI001C983024|nr:hypothetical protein [Leisingera daeponensis]MBY6054947.1 hypothetical protein [Leisingera daeponensis]
MAYESKPMGNRLGIYADKITEIRKREGLTPAGFQHNGTDAAGADKEAMEREMYRRADSHMSGFASALGGHSTPPDSETEGLQDEE